MAKQMCSLFTRYIASSYALSVVTLPPKSGASGEDESKAYNANYLLLHIEHTVSARVKTIIHVFRKNQRKTFLKVVEKLGETRVHMFNYS